ncbi:MAG TPA: Rieske (2Fe-2S) protein [Actinomycetes bacterium]|nr:Rieske (2Fe-2S) protein [Actinomycetes bacterium]
MIESREPTEIRDEANPELAEPGVARRTVVQGAALAGVGLALAACGKAATETTTPNAQSSPTDAPSSDPAGGSGSGSIDGLAATADIPVDGGVIVEKVVITQPEKGTFKAFTAVCTHLGCIVDEVADNVITCPCHGSTYSAADGSVLGGPAPSPLAEVPVEVQDGQVVRA